MLDKIDELDLIDSTLADTLECISYYTGGLSMRKCYTLIDRDRLPEIQKDLKLGIRTNLGKTIVAYGEYKDYIIRKAKLENKIYKLDRITKGAMYKQRFWKRFVWIQLKYRCLLKCNQIEKFGCFFISGKCSKK